MRMKVTEKVAALAVEFEAEGPAEEVIAAYGVWAKANEDRALPKPADNSDQLGIRYTDAPVQ